MSYPQFLYRGVVEVKRAKGLGEEIDPGEWDGQWRWVRRDVDRVNGA
jgi:hypothetical protein